MKGHLEQHGRNRWSLVVELGRDADGKRVRRRQSFDGGKRGAERELSKLINAVETGTYADPQRMSVGEYLEHWLTHAESTVSVRTYERYRDIVRLHLSPALGTIKLGQLKPMHISSYYSQALKTGRLPSHKKRQPGEPAEPKRGLSAQTVRHHHRVLHLALKQAVRWQMLASNPADAVTPPRPERRDMTTLDESQTAALLRDLVGTRMYVPVLLAVTTGLRRGELLALRWGDIDLDSGALSVCRSLQLSREKGLLFREPKTAKSRRVVKLLPMAVEALREHRRRQTECRWALLANGELYEDNDLVICHTKSKAGPKPLLAGRPWRPDTLTSWWEALAKSRGLGLRLHDLRHTHATQLMRANVATKVVSERLGHASTSITSDIYSHVMPDTQEAAVEKLDAALSGALAELG